MTLSASSLESLIKTNLPGTPTLDEGGGNQIIRAIAQAVVAEVEKAEADVTFTTAGTCGNFTTPPPASVPTPGAYSGTIEATNAGTLSGLSATALASAIQQKIEAALSDEDFTQGAGLACLAAVSEAIVEEVHTNGRVTLASTPVTGTSPAAGGTPTGSISAQGQVSNLSSARIHQAIKTKIRNKVDLDEDSTLDDVDFSAEFVDDTIEAIAQAVVAHIESDAQVAISTDFTGVLCPANPGPSPGLASTGSVSDADAEVN